MRNQKSETRNQNGRRGGALLDMVFVLPILLGLAFGVVEYGYYFFVKHNVQAAAREGARAAVVPAATLQNVVDAVGNVMTAAGLGSTGYTISLTDPSSGVAINLATVTAGTSIKVTVQCTWGSVGIHPLPEVMGGISPSKLVRGATVMRREG